MRAQKREEIKCILMTQGRGWIRDELWKMDRILNTELGGRGEVHKVKDLEVGKFWHMEGSEN